MVRRTAGPFALVGAGLASVTRQRPRIATERSRSRIANRPSVPTARSPEAGSTSAPSDAKVANFSTNSSIDVQRVATWISGPREAVVLTCELFFTHVIQRRVRVRTRHLLIIGLSGVALKRVRRANVRRV